MLSRHIKQERCPYNVRFALETEEPDYAARGPDEPPGGVEPLDSLEIRHPGTESPPLIDLLEVALDESAWNAFSRGSAVRRAGRAGFARNVCVGLGNWGSEKAIPVLTSALRDREPLVRAHAAWALGQVGSPAAESALSSLLRRECDPMVTAEIHGAESG
jgi:epoxyqueuosine reductase